MDEMSGRIQLYVDGQLDAKGVAALQEWICASEENAQEFAREMVVHQQIRERLKSEVYSDTIRVLTSPCVRHANLIQPKRFPWARTALIAASLIATLAAVLWFTPSARTDRSRIAAPRTPAPTYAQVIKTDNAQIHGMGTITAGRTLPAGSDLELTLGVIQLRMNSGATVIIEAPSIFRLTEDNRMRLLQGRLAADVPTYAIGFTVDSPTVQVIDLSTAFGVEVDGNGVTDVHVFEGQVETKHTAGSSSKPLRLKKEQAKRFGKGRADKLREAAGEAHRFLRQLLLADGITHIRGPIRFLKEPPDSVVPGSREDNKKVLMFPERRGIWIEESLVVSMTDPGKVVQLQSPATSSVLTPGVRVRSYLLHVDPIGSGGKIKATIRRSGSVRFKRPILAVIAAADLLQQTTPMFGHSQTRYGNDLGGLDGKDMIKLSRDRRTVTFNLSTRPHVDQVRILVADPG
jgi:ferric-dicitrate binding protein FerR (iron transport regulator)